MLRSKPATGESISINYHFRFQDDTELELPIEIDVTSLERIRPQREEWPEWVKMEFHQCRHCTVSASEMPHCPMATNLVDLVEACASMISHDTTTITVATPERTISTYTTLQRGIASVMGLLMATSGCPYTHFFKPMARFHLPFASEQETLYRASTMYLLGNYFRTKEKLSKDIDLQGLIRIYHDIQEVNMAMSARVRTAIQHDASLNAVVILDMLAKIMPLEIEDSLEELRYLYQAYLKD